MRGPIHSSARRRSLESWRGVLGLVAALALAVPAPVVGAAACALGAGGDDCARCEAMRAAEPARSCHGETAVAASTAESGSCHQAERAGDCCRFQADRHAARPAAAGISAPPSVEWSHALVSVLPSGAPELAAARPAACESPPGLVPLLRTQSSILRL